MRQYLALSFVAIGLFATGCDNVGRAFDRNVTPGDPGSTTGEVIIEAVPEGGDTRDGRPKVKATFPEGGGWPTTVPIVVEFTESVNQTSIEPTSANGTDGRILLRVKGQTQALPCQYDFVAGGRLLVMRPTPTLSNANNPTYEVVLLPDARDCDGVRFQVDSEGLVLSEFQVNQAESFVDGRVLTTFPRDNQRDGTRSTDYFVIFDRPANAISITSSNFVLRPQGGAALAGDIDLPLEVASVDDPRVVRFAPASNLAASTRYELVVDDTITFGSSGTLDFKGRTPYATFDTIGPVAPTAVVLQNFTAGYPDKINRNNFDTVMLAVTAPADAAAGDRIVARIYGNDASTTATGDLTFLERTVSLDVGGAQTVAVDFTGALGTLASPKFDDGDIQFAVQLRRGSQQSGYTYNDSSTSPRFDLTPPTLTQAGPAGGSTTDLRIDQEQLVFFGVASEKIGEATLAANSLTATLFASSDDGRFVMRPILLSRQSAPVSYSLLLTDSAGNLATAAVTGNVLQRGLVTGTLAGTLTVEAFDDATLLPIAGATVLVDPGTPTVPATGQLVGTTDADGRASFTVAGSSHTVTIVRAGYDLVSFYDTAAAFVSLPLRPLADATATFNGLVGFAQSAGTTALVGNSALDDPSTLAVATASATPTVIPDTAIRPARPQVITAFGGSIEPTASPTFSLLGYQMLGPTLLVPAPPAAPATGGETSRQTLTMIPSTGSLTSGTALTLDFSLASGLDTANLVGGKPIVRPMVALSGFGGQVLNGIGYASLQSGSSYTVLWDFGGTAAVGLGAFTPFQWIATQARDSSGRISRHRALYFIGLQNLFTAPPSIPTVTAPSGPVTGSPSVEYADVVNSALLTDAVGASTVQLVDAAGRTWRLLVADADAATGTDTVQFPDLATNNVAGLATGVWTATVESRVFWPIPSATTSDFVLSEQRRQEVTYARSAGQEITVQ